VLYSIVFTYGMRVSYAVDSAVENGSFCWRVCQQIHVSW